LYQFLTGFLFFSALDLMLKIQINITDMCRKYKKDPKEHRPDILHQELLALIDSPLNKAGYLQVYIKTHKGILIEVHPSMRVPRTYKRFAGLMVQLLHKLKIKAAGSSTTLLKVIKNPFSQHLPPGTRVYAMSVKGTLYAPLALATALVPPTPQITINSVAVDRSSAKVQPPICFVIGAMAAGHIAKEDHPYIEEFFSISEYPLSGAAACSRILTAIEHQWGIV
jgi:rRNA small subunit pseudouridine methyltransferase Nep1